MEAGLLLADFFYLSLLGGQLFDALERC